MKKNHNIIEIAAILKHETRPTEEHYGAFLLFDGKTTGWVPKSLVQNNNDGTFSMPEWLAQDKGFI